MRVVKTINHTIPHDGVADRFVGWMRSKAIERLARWPGVESIRWQDLHSKIVADQGVAVKNALPFSIAVSKEARV
jgi:hypothetical protein